MNRQVAWVKRALTRLVCYRTEEEVDFSFGWFIAFVTIQTVVFIALIYTVCYIFRRDYLMVQLTTTWPVFLACFATFHLSISLFEFMFHRYVLHHVVWRFLANIWRKHTQHHTLDHVREFKPRSRGKAQTGVSNRYPITEPDQIESSAFPAWALVAFWGFFSIVVIPVQIVLPKLPILTTGYLAVVFSFSLYEIIHAIEHLDYQCYWKKWVEKYPIARECYGFHLIHHAEITINNTKVKLHNVNEAIGGYFGLPIWDWIFGTYYVPNDLPLPGNNHWPNIKPPPPPRQPIRYFDSIAANIEARWIERLKLANQNKSNPP